MQFQQNKSMQQRSLDTVLNGHLVAAYYSSEKPTDLRNVEK